MRRGTALLLAWCYLGSCLGSVWLCLPRQPVVLLFRLFALVPKKRWGGTAAFPVQMEIPQRRHNWGLGRVSESMLRHLLLLHVPCQSSITFHSLPSCYHTPPTSDRISPIPSPVIFVGVFLPPRIPHFTRDSPSWAACQTTARRFWTLSVSPQMQLVRFTLVLPSLISRN
jgi:hypothetical protein